MREKWKGIALPLSLSHLWGTWPSEDCSAVPMGHGAGHAHQGLAHQKQARLWPGCQGHVPHLWTTSQQGFPAMAGQRGGSPWAGGPVACGQCAHGAIGHVPLTRGGLSSGHHGVPVPQLPVSQSQLSRVWGRLAPHYCLGEAERNWKGWNWKGWGPSVATHSWPSGSMSGCPLRATTRTRQRALAGRRCQWQHPTFANARFLSASPWDQYAGASAGHTQGPHLGEYPYTRLAEGQVLGPTTHLQIRGVVQGGHWNPYMAGFYEDAGDVADPQVSLISSYFGHLVPIPTPLLCWYLLNGLVVTHLYLLMQDDSRWGFKSLAGDCAQKRRDTQRDPPQALARELAKLLMTSLYGKSCENKKRFLRTYFMKAQRPARPSAPTVSGTWDLCCPHLNLSWTQRTCLGTASSIRMMSLRQKWRITTSWLWHKNVWPCTCPSRSPSLCMAMYTVHGHW